MDQRNVVDSIPAPTDSFGVSGHLEWIRADDLNVDHDYQRVLSELQVRKIVRDFDPDAFGVIIVSARSDGRMYVVDGQHRMAAIKTMGWGDQRVPCLVYRELSLQDEAKVFYLPQTTRRGMSPAERFRARLIANDPVAHQVKSLVEGQGYSLNLRSAGSQEPRELDAVAAIEAVWKISPENLINVLSIFNAAWGVDEFKIQGNLINGLSVFLRRYHPDYDRLRVIQTLRMAVPTRIESNSREIMTALGGNKQDAVARSILKLYNNKLQSRRLPDWESVKNKR